MLSVGLFLLGFFLLLVSLSGATPHQVQAVKDSVEATFRRDDGTAPIPRTASRGTGELTDGWYLAGRLAEMVEASLIDDPVAMMLSDRALRVNFPASIAFDRGGAQPSAAMLGFLDQIAAAISDVPAGAAVDSEIAIDPSTALAVERTANLAAALTARGADPRRLTIMLAPGKRDDIRMTLRIGAAAADTPRPGSARRSTP